MKLLARVLVLLLAAVGLTVVVSPTASAGAPYSFNWNGVPGSPQPWNNATQGNFDLIVHTRGQNADDHISAVNAQHGPNCEPYTPGNVTHVAATATDAVYVCNNHMMTALNQGDYGVAYFTPPQQVDFSGGASVGFNLSTNRTSDRDWVDMWITPFSENLTLPLNSVELANVDLNGTPRDAIHIHMDQYNHGTIFRADLIQNFQTTSLGSDWWDTLEAVMASHGQSPSANVRTPFTLDLTTGHLRFGMTLADGSHFYWVDHAMSPSFSNGIVQFGHHSYNPTKGDGCGPPPESTVGCQPNTWHWSNLTISNAVPFTIDQGSPAFGGNAQTVTLATPAPVGGFLRFAAQSASDAVNVSYDGGPFQPATLANESQHRALGNNYGIWDSFWTPIPAGTQTVTFSAAAPCCSLQAAFRDMTVWSQNASSPTPTPSPTATPTPTPSPTATPTPTPSPSATPTPTPAPTPTPTPTAGTANHVGAFWLYGANMPWLNWNADFGGSSGGVHQNLAEVDTKLAAAHAAGMHEVRWWVFEGGSPQIARDSAGTPTGVSAAVYTDLDAALTEAAKYDISFNFVLFGSTNDDAMTHQWWESSTKRSALATVLAPLFAHYAANPRVHTWEIVNEPDWQIRNGLTTVSGATATVDAIADQVHANSPALVTVGEAQLQDMATWVGHHLDYHSPHYYDNFGSGSNDPFLTAVQSPDGKPVVIGEFPAGAGLTPSAQQRWQALYQNGYAGGWAWSLSPEHTSDKLAVDMSAAGAFATGKTDLGPIVGTSPTPTPQPTPQPTPSVSPSVPPPSPTPTPTPTVTPTPSPTPIMLANHIPGGINGEPSIRPWRYTGANPDGWWCVIPNCFQNPSPMTTVNNELALAHRLGVQNVREEFPWALIEPGNGVYDWTRADAIVAAATAAGVTLQPVLVFTPSWAASGETIAPNGADYQAFVNTIVNRYKGSIHTWEMWNEPDHFHYWNSGEQAYVTSIVIPGYNGAKAADPTATVILAGTSTWNGTWFSGIFSGQGGSSFDVVAYHDYGGSPQNSAATVKSNETAHGINKPIWLGEYGVQEGSTSDTQQQGLMTAVLTSSAPLAMAQWYNLRDDNSMTCCPAVVAVAGSWGLVMHDDSTMKNGFATMQAILGSAPPPPTPTPTPGTTPTPSPTPTPTPAATATPAPGETPTPQPTPAPTPTPTQAPSPQPTPTPSQTPLPGPTPTPTPSPVQR